MIRLRKVILSFFLFFCAIHTQAQKFKIDTLQFQGTNNNMVNFVVLGDGYTAAELNYLREDAERFVDYFFQTEPFAQYRNFFNVFLINTISEQSGAVHECVADDCPHEQHGHSNLPARFNEFRKFTEVPQSNPSTIFGSAFDNYGIHRLVIARKDSAIRAVLSAHIPDYTQTIVLVNSPYYGGSGGEFPTATVNIASNDIAVHEIGHSFANLGDEYWAGNMYAVERANRSQKGDPALVPWKHWLGMNGVGVFSYGAEDSRAQWFRPHEFCKMQHLVAPFCSVCQEVIVKTVHDKTNPIVSSRPFANRLALLADTIDKFVLKLAKPIPNTFQIKWYLNNELVAANIDSVYINMGVLKRGDNELRATVTDTTNLVRDTTHRSNSYFISWTIRSDQQYKLAKPRPTWGDTVTTCYGGVQALTVKSPQAGLRYRWYDSEGADVPMATTYNMVTPPIFQDKTFFVESVWKGKVSERTAIFVRVLPQIPKVGLIKVSHDEVSGLVQFNVDDPTKKYKYIFTSEDGSPLFSWNPSSERYDWREQTDGKLILPKSDLPEKVFVHVQDAVTTCVGERTEAVIR